MDVRSLEFADLKCSWLVDAKATRKTKRLMDNKKLSKWIFNAS